MVLSQELIDKGFSVSNVNESDFDIYFTIVKASYEKYVDEYFGGWIDDVQLKMNRDAFDEAMSQSAFMKIHLHDEIVGNFAFDERDDKIDGIMIQMLEKAQNTGFGSFYLEYVTTLANCKSKPVFLKVFKTNPAKELYARHGFVFFDETVSHFLMRYDPVE